MFVLRTSSISSASPGQQVKAYNATGKLPNQFCDSDHCSHEAGQTSPHLPFHLKSRSLHEPLIDDFGLSL